MIKKKLSQKSNLADKLRSSLTSGHQLAGGDQRNNIMDTSGQTTFLYRMSGLSLRGQEAQSYGRKSVEPLLLHRTQMGMLSQLERMTPRSFPGEVLCRHVPLEGGPGKDPNHAGGIMGPGFPRKTMMKWLGSGKSGLFCLAYWPCDLCPDQQKKYGWKIYLSISLSNIYQSKIDMKLTEKSLVLLAQRWTGSQNLLFSSYWNEKSG